MGPGTFVDDSRLPFRVVGQDRWSFASVARSYNLAKESFPVDLRCGGILMTEGYRARTAWAALHEPRPGDTRTDLASHSALASRESRERSPCYVTCANLCSILCNLDKILRSEPMKSKRMTRAPGRARPGGFSVVLGAVPSDVPRRPLRMRRVDRRSAAPRHTASRRFDCKHRGGGRGQLSSPERIRVSTNTTEPRSRPPTEDETVRLY